MMEAAERQPGNDEQEEQGMFVDTAMLESDIQILESEIMTPSPMHSALHEGLNTNFQTPAGKLIAEEDNGTVSSVRTPADNLLDKFQSLNESWVDVKTRSASTKKRVMATPSMDDLLNSPIPKFPSALEAYCTADTAADRDDENDDVSSIGASTTSSISSQESVFDRLHKHGTNQQRRRRRQKPSDSFISPREHISTNEFYTPYSSTSSVSVTSSTSRSRTSASKRQTKKIKNRVVPTSAAKSSATKSISNSESKVSPTPSQDSVFDRLYRNQKRTEILWQAPAAPQLRPSTDRKKSSRRKSGRPSKIPAPSTPQTASKPQLKKKRISSTPSAVSKRKESTSGGNEDSSIGPLLEAASSTSDSIDVAAAASPLVEDSTTDSTTVRSSAARALDEVAIASEKENKLRPTTVPAPREQPTALKNANWSTTSIDEDLAELAAIQRDLDQQQQHLAPTPRKTNVPLGKIIGIASSIEPKQLYASNASIATTAANPLLDDDLDDILKTPEQQVSRSSAPSVASTATHTHVEDDDTTSRTSSGFFTLDFAQSPLTLQPLVSFPNGSSIDSRQPSTEQAAISIQSWWKSCLAKISLANMVIEHRNMTFPSAHDTSPVVLLRIINTTRPHNLRIEQRNDVLVAQSPQISLEIRLVSPTFSILRRQLSNTMLLRSALAAARVEFEGIVFVEASHKIQRWWRRTRKNDGKMVEVPSSAIKVTTSARENELSFYLQDASRGMLDEELLETLSHGSPDQESLDRPLTEPQKTPICQELSLLDDGGDSDDELLVSPAKPLVSRPNEITEGRELFPTPSHGLDSSGGDGDEEGSVGGHYDPVPVETPDRARKDRPEQAGEDYERHEAANVIQRSFRITTLACAVEQNTPTRDLMRQALSSPKFPRFTEDDPWLKKEPSDGFRLWLGSTDLIEQHAARLATHNIVRAYLNGLRKYRRTKKATLIQSTFRRYQCELEYRKKVWAIVAIQRGWKTLKHRTMLRSKATKIMAAYKMKLAKTKYQTMRFAAILIQNQWRTFDAIREYSKAQFLASWLQRTCVRGRRHRQRYLALQSATISLQYCFRMHSTKKQYELEMVNATRIQSVWRMSFAQRERLLAIFYACKIQALVRSHFESRQYLRLRSSSIAVQSAWRRHSAQRTYQLQRYGTVLAQSLWRRCLAVRWYRHQYKSVVWLQSLGRMQQCVRLKHNSLQAVVVIQREARRLLAERAFIIVWKAILMIQTQQRRHAAQQSWFKTMTAVICLQSVGRAHIARRSFRKHRDAVVKMQSLGRSYNQRSCYLVARQDIVRAQSIFRQLLAQNNLRKSRAAAISCQKTIRFHLSLAAFKKGKTACTNIQKAYRRFHAIQNWEIALKSIIRIQSFLRMIHARDTSSFALSSVRILQRVFRGYQQRCKFNIEREAAVKIQSIVRCSVDQSQYSEQRKASIVIQAFARGNAAKYRLQEAMLAAVILQKTLRQLLYRSSYLQMQASARCIQAIARGFSERLRYNKTRNQLSTIQRIWRGAIARVRSSAHYRATLLIQRCWRGYAGRILTKQRTHRIIAMQRYSRGYISRSQHDRIRHRRLLLVQSTWRAAIWRRRFAAHKKASLSIQTMIRGYLARKESMLQLVSAVVIQRHWRMALCQEKYSRTRVSAVMIQGLVRGICVRNTIARFHKVATRVQKHWRGHIGRLEYTECVEKRNAEIAAARLAIQSTWRMHVARVEFRQVKNATISIQTKWRAFSAREEFVFTRFSCILIQAITRGALVRTRKKLCHECSLVIQRSWHRYLGAKRFELLLEEDRSAKIEKAERMRRVELMGFAVGVFHGLACISVVVQKDIARQKSAYTHSACITIQSFARGILVRSQNRNRSSSVSSSSNRRLRDQSVGGTNIQSIDRRRVAKRYHDAKLQSASMIQKHWRSLQARQNYDIARASCVMIQSALRGSQTRSEFKTLRKSALCIQGVWRGHADVKKLEKMKSLRESALLQRSLAATKIQSMNRMQLANKSHHSRLRSIVAIQKCWRSAQARKHFEICRVSSVTIQSIARGSLVRNEVKSWNAAGIIVQKHWRCALARERYELFRTSCVIIQSIIRGSFIRKRTDARNESAIRCQIKTSKIVQNLAGHSSMEQMNAATMMKSPPRTPRTKPTYHSALSIDYKTPENQDRYEDRPVSHSDVPSISAIDVVHDLLNRSATPIQKVWRGASLRGSLESSRTLSTSAATLIQAWFRCHRARQLYQTTLAAQSGSATTLQSVIGGTVTRNVLARGLAAVSIQRFWRNRSLRIILLQRSMDEILTKELEDSYRTQAAIVLQSLARRRIAQESFCTIRNFVIAVQSLVRGRQCRVRLNDGARAAITIQKYMRRASARIHIRELHSGAITIQKYVRRATARSHIRGRHNGATIIQSFVRMFLVSRLFWFLRLPRASREILNIAARKIQVAFFLFKMRLAILSMQSSAIILKRCIRGQLVRSAAKFALVHVNSAFHNPVILSFARVVAGNDPDYAPTYVAWRRAVTQAELSSAIVIQSAVRRFLVRARIAIEFNVSFDSHMLLDQTLIQEEKGSALILQQAFRGWICRKAYNLQLDQTLVQEKDTSTRIIQQAFRASRSRCAYNLLLENRSSEKQQAAIHLQRMARGRKCRILARGYRTTEAQVSRNATAIVLKSIQRSSKARVDQLLTSQSSTAPLSSSLQRIADRTRVARREAAMLASNPLPTYAIDVLKKLEIQRVLQPNVQTKEQINPIWAETNVSSLAQLEPRRPSTPVRCNKTQTIKKAVQRNSLGNRKDVKKRTLAADDPRRMVDNSQSVLSKPQSSYGMGSFDLLKFGRETMQKKKKAHMVKSSMKPNTLQAPKTNMKLSTSKQVPKSPPKRVNNEGEARKTTLFGDPNNMPSPIKKQNDWDWADEW